MTTNKKLRWSVASTGNHQGLIVDEESGANIAVAYDKRHAPLLAAAPELLAECETEVHMLENLISDLTNGKPVSPAGVHNLAARRNALALSIQRATEGRT